MNAIAVQALQGMSVAMVLFLFAAGLSIIFGLMDILNFAHGALYALGAYVGMMVSLLTGNFWLALVVTPIGLLILGALLERTALRRLYGRDPVYHFLLTFGVMFVLTDVIRILWGDDIKPFQVPAELAGSLSFGITFPAYRLFIIFAAAAIAVGVWLILTRTSFGLLLRAGVQNREMVSILGVDIQVIFTFGFALGAGLAGIAGVLVGPTAGVFPQMGAEVLVQAFIVVIIGGLGSFRGAAAAALLVGEIQAFGILWLPGASTLVIYVAMILILLFRPSGLFAQGEV